MAGSRESPAAYTATSSTLQLRTFLVDALSFREHALVEYARYQDPLGFNPVEQNMPPVFHAAQAGPHMIAGTTQLGVVGKLSATGFQIVDVTDGLVLPPGVLHTVCPASPMSSRSASARRDKRYAAIGYHCFLERCSAPRTRW